MHHVAWGVACAMMMAVVTGLWSSLQTSESENAQLRKALYAANQPPSTCKTADAWKPDSTKQFTVATSDGPRDYQMHVPKEFKDTAYYPLVMVYPGRGETAQSAQGFGLNGLPAITVYPFPTISQNGDWAWEGSPYSSSADDVGFTQNILDKVDSDMCIDKTHVYAAGYSNGGGFVSLLSCKLPGRFAAYAIESAALYRPESDCQPPRPAPIISAHGDNDSIVPYSGVPERDLPAVYDWMQGRAAYEKCSGPTTTFPNAGIEVTSWNKCRGGAAIENVRVIGGGHDWGDAPNDMVWQFLTRFSL